MNEVVAVVGLGYVGLPLAVEFGKKFDTIGYDLSAAKIDSYRRFSDPTGEVSSEDLRAAARLTPTEQTLKQLIKNGSPLPGAKVIVLGLTFKENCPDLRNSKVADVVRELKELGCEVSVHDPIADSRDAVQEYDVALTSWEELPLQADAIVAAVPHRSYLAMPFRELLSRLKRNAVFIDVKSAFDRTAVGEAGFRMWRL